MNEDLFYERNKDFFYELLCVMMYDALGVPRKYLDIYLEAGSKKETNK